MNLSNSKLMERKIKELDAFDKQIVLNWPHYPEPYHELDYSLREGGWLDTIGAHPGCKKYGYYIHDVLSAFSLLDVKTIENAEFLIAVKGDFINKGIGKEFCIKTLKQGFEELNLCRIFLKVRINHSIGIRLYEKVGFKKIGETWEITDNKNVHFYLMEIYKSEFQSAFH